MGLSEFLSEARLAYHGYTPQVIENMRNMLQQKEQERQWRAYEDRRRLELAEEAGKRAADEAEAQRAADKRAQEEKREKSLYEQLKLLPDGADITRLMGVEDVPVGVVRALQERVKGERQYAQELAEAERTRKAAEKKAEDAADEARGLRTYRRHREIDKEFAPPREAPAETVDPFVARALGELSDFRRDPLSAPPELRTKATVDVLGKPTQVDALDAAKADAWIQSRAAALRQLSRDFRGVPGAKTPPTADPLTPDERTKLLRLPPDDQSEAERVLASGNPALITELRKRLGTVR